MGSYSLLATLLASTSFFAGTLALNKLPHVKAVPIANCSGFPNYDPSTGTSGAWSPFVDQSHSPAEGYGDSVQIVYTGAPEVQIVRVCLVLEVLPHTNHG